MKILVLTCVLVVLCVLQVQAAQEIGRACSTPETSKFPFCDKTLPVDQRVDDLISRLDLLEKAPLLTARMSPGGCVPHLGLPEYDWGANCVHGVQSRCGTKCPTSFPNPNALGATFNMSLVYDMAEVIGIELRSLWLQNVGEYDKGDPHIGLDCWSPNININRDPRWGRNEEVATEDPYLMGRFAVAYTTGLQTGKLDPRYLQAVVTLKHWAAYSLEAYGNTTRDNYNAVVSDYDLADTYFPAWQAAVTEGDAKGVMCSYNSVNGVPACASAFLNKQLRDEWKFNGYVTSDSGAIKDISETHHYTKTFAGAVAKALNDGMCDIDSGGVYLVGIPEAHALGWLNNTVLDDALRHTLKLRFELGLFDPIEDQPYWHVSPDVVNTEASQAKSKLSTLQSLVLLKNDEKTLPFAPSAKVAVIGPHANATKSMIGNYYGQICPGDHKDFSCVVTPYLAIDALTTEPAVYAKGCDISGSSTKGFDEAIAAAKAADVVVMVMGIDDSIEAEHKDRYSIEFPGVQAKLIDAIAALNKSMVVVLFNGGMVALDALAVSPPHVAILEAFYPGLHGGTALAAALFGQYNPGGKLPITIYPGSYVDAVDFLSMDMTKAPGRTYRYYTGQPTYPFGYGLSYTTFTLEWSSLHAMPAHKQGYQVLSCSQANDAAEYAVKVTNTGPVAGDEVVLAFHKPGEGVDSPLIKQLFGFQRVHLDPGKSVTVHFKVQQRDVQLVNSQGEHICVPGEHRIIFTNGVKELLEGDLRVM